MSRSSVVPSGARTSNRVELVPQSIAATVGVVTSGLLGREAIGAAQLGVDPRADGIVTTGQEPGVVRMQTLHTAARAADPT